MIEPGIYYEMSNEDYHSNTDHLSKGTADKLQRAPALTQVPQEETKALFDGRAIHTFCLEPEKARKIYYRLQADHNGRTKAGQAHVAKVAESGLTPLAFEDWNKYAAMANAVWAHPRAAAILEKAIIESSIFWDDEDTKCPCKCRPDIARPDLDLIADLKSTTDASYDSFRKAIANFRYHVQGAHYLEGSRTVWSNIDKFLIIAVEKSPPYLVAVYQLDKYALQKGAMAIEVNRYQFLECKKKNDWPGYPEDIQLIDLPSWA